ncbi:MAG: hypothetical protein QNJ29_08365 [Rhizobiaceae bacterium]|nr:hypothetical protein [Rhizobiaceae bacterium]
MSFLFKFICVCGGVAVLVAANLFRYNEPIDVRPLIANKQGARQSLISQETTDLSSVAQLSELQFVQTFSRPLFSETRKKFVKPAPKKKQPAKKVAKKKADPTKPAPKIRILGLSTSNGAKKTLIKLAGSPNPEWVSEGEKIGGWEVVEIATDSIKIANANREVSIDLFPKQK